MQELFFGRFLKELEEYVTDLQYLINNPNKPYHEWFQFMVSTIDNINNTRRDLREKYNLGITEFIEKPFNKAVENYFEDDQDFYINQLIEDNS